MLLESQFVKLQTPPVCCCLLGLLIHVPVDLKETQLTPLQGNRKQKVSRLQQEEARTAAHQQQAQVLQELHATARSCHGAMTRHKVRL
jgi:hypothetical protein